MTESTVTCLLPLRLLSGDGAVIPLDAVLKYDAADPLAVSALFDSGTEEPVRWTFARDLLRQGLHRRSGEGDLVVWPSVDDGGEPTVDLRLCSPDGDALMEAPAALVEAFLDKTAEAVPFGDEELLLDVEGALQAILDGIS